MENAVKEVLKITCPDMAHGYDHFVAVRDHAIEAVKELDIPEKDLIITAAFLHDLDDYKVVKGKTPEHYWVDHILNTFEYSDEDKRIIKRMIDLVSLSKNGDSYDPNLPTWYYIPRYCDRLEAIGEIGVERCLDYNKGLGNPLHCEDTARVTTLEELKSVATKERYENYVTRVVEYPNSVIDHFYSKLLHVNLPEWLHNTYLRNEFSKRQGYMEKYILDYWN